MVTSLSPLAAINQIINSDKRYEIKGSSILIKETDKSATLKKVEITGVDLNTVAFEFDKSGHTGKAFNITHKKVHKACDAIIFCQLDDEYFILFCELKTSVPSDGKHVVQLRSGLCWVQYLRAILNEFEGIDMSHWQYRYIVFHKNQYLPKTLTSIAPIANQQPRTPLLCQVDDGEKVSLRKLLQQPL